MSGLFKMAASRVDADAHHVGDLTETVRIYFNTRISPAEINRRLLTLGVPQGTQIGPYRAQITYPDFSVLPSTVEAVQAHIEATILKSRDPVALDALNELFCIVPSDLADYVHRLAEIDHTAAQLLLEGRLETALQRLPVQRWGEVAGKFEVGTEDVGKFLADFILVWVLNDLQLAAEAAHVKIYTPTGIPALDGPDPTIAPKIDGVSKRVEDEVKLFDKAFKIWESLKPGEQARKKDTRSLRDRGLDRQARSFLAQWLWEIRKDPTISRQELEKRIFAELKNGRNAVDKISKVIKKVRRKKPGSNRLTVNHNRWLYSLQKPMPLDQLYLACRFAAGWIEPAGTARRWVEALVNSLCGVPQASAPSVSTPVRVPQAPIRGATVQTLFYIIRNAVVQDPHHLPEELRSIADPQTGKKVQVRSNYEMRRKIGSTVSFMDIWGAFSKENHHDQGQTTITDSTVMFMAKAEKKVVDQARRRAQGTVLQRLGV